MKKNINYFLVLIVALAYGSHISAVTLKGLVAGLVLGTFTLGQADHMQAPSPRPVSTAVPSCCDQSNQSSRAICFYAQGNDKSPDFVKSAISSGRMVFAQGPDQKKYLQLAWCCDNKALVRNPDGQYSWLSQPGCRDVVKQLSGADIKKLHLDF